MDSNTMTVEEVDTTASEFLDGEIVDLASDWLGNTVSRADRGNAADILTYRSRWCKSCSRNARLPQDWPCLKGSARISP
jgi:hypothetical protein